MKKIAAILFLSAYLLSATELSELLKLPILLEHFRHHSHHHDERFLDFVAEHYFNHGNKDDRDNHDHENLPFHQHANSLVFQLFVAPALPKNFSESTSFAEDRTIQPVNRQKHYNSAFLFSIWQPPKITC